MSECFDSAVTIEYTRGATRPKEEPVRAQDAPEPRWQEVEGMPGYFEPTGDIGARQTEAWNKRPDDLIVEACAMVWQKKRPLTRPEKLPAKSASDQEQTFNSGHELSTRSAS